MSDEFLRQFWPQFWGSVMATIFIALLTIVFAYVARLRIARFVKETFASVKNTIVTEEEKLKEELISRK